MTQQEKQVRSAVEEFMSSSEGMALADKKPDSWAILLTQLQACYDMADERNWKSWAQDSARESPKQLTMRLAMHGANRLRFLEDQKR